MPAEINVVPHFDLFGGPVLELEPHFAPLRINFRHGGGDLTGLTDRGTGFGPRFMPNTRDRGAFLELFSGLRHAGHDFLDISDHELIADADLREIDDLRTGRDRSFLSSRCDETYLARCRVHCSHRGFDLGGLPDGPTGDSLLGADRRGLFTGDRTAGLKEECAAGNNGGHDGLDGRFHIH